MAFKYTVSERKTMVKGGSAKDAKCPDPSAHTTPKKPEPGKETGGNEIG